MGVLVINKNIWLGLYSLLLFTLGSLFGVSFGNKPAYGDTVLKFIGLNSWSNSNNTGLHYTTVIALILLILSVILGYMFFKTLELENMNEKRRIDTWECKVSILIVIISSFVVPGKIIENGYLIKYAFGFPCNYWFVYQDNKRSSQLFENLFNGNTRMNINILGLFINIIIIYCVLILLRKIYVKVKTML